MVSWERECVRQEILDNTYELKVQVDICMMVDMKKIYRVGEGIHSRCGKKAFWH